MLHIFKKGVSAIAFASLMLILFASVEAQTSAVPVLRFLTAAGACRQVAVLSPCRESPRMS